MPVNVDAVLQSAVCDSVGGETWTVLRGVSMDELEKKVERLWARFCAVAIAVGEVTTGQTERIRVHRRPLFMVRHLKNLQPDDFRKIVRTATDAECLSSFSQMEPFTPPECVKPTCWPPGTNGRINAMRERVRLGQPVFDDRDAKVLDGV